MVVHTDAFLLIEVDPALWEEGVRVWKYVWVNLVEDGGHADDGLGLLEEDTNSRMRHNRGKI